jgi:DNA-3-methyladenine glycosylase II
MSMSPGTASCGQTAASPWAQRSSRAYVTTGCRYAAAGSTSAAWRLLRRRFRTSESSVVSSGWAPPPSISPRVECPTQRQPASWRRVTRSSPDCSQRQVRPASVALASRISPHWVRAIVYQQLATPAATAIHGRLLAVLGGDPGPGALIALPDETLRAAGLSANKAASLRDLATKVLEGTVVLSPRGLGRQSDEEVVARLTAVRGIGPWTADMFLLFQLRRLDVWPAGDLGVRRGYGLAWNVSMPSARALQPLGEPYRPYRSIAAWYCWRAAELYAGAADSALTR